MRRRDLIVPIHDRRKRKRYLTLKNAAIATFVCFIAFVAISIRSEMRGRGPVDYGGEKLSLPSPPPEPEPVEVVQEVPSSTFVDEQLGEPAPPPLPPPLPPPPRTEAAVPRGDSVAIVGGPEGVAIVRQEPRRPTLSGGFGRSD